ncbi:MAG TPA: hypothetical protein DCO77_00545 [Nitrospiraceae bacterium]|nr:hypothetical protein [Nitrospiraceae bacterium]
MNQSILVQFIRNNLSGLQPLDYAILGVVAAILLFMIVFLFRKLFSLLFRKVHTASGSASGISVLKGGGVFAHQELFELSAAERGAFERQVSAINETFASLAGTYREKKSQGAVPEDLSERLLNYSLSLRGSFMEVIAAANAFLVFERLKFLLVMYSHAGIEERFPDSPRAGELAQQLNVIRQRIVDPLLAANRAALPDPVAFFNQFTVSGTGKYDVEVFNREMDSIYEAMKTYVERFLRTKKKVALVAEVTKV